jgi:hypothetical protein
VLAGTGLLGFHPGRRRSRRRHLALDGEFFGEPLSVPSCGRASASTCALARQPYEEIEHALFIVAGRPLGDSVFRIALTSSAGRAGVGRAAAAGIRAQ